MGREQLEHLGEAAGGQAVVPADARALLEMEGASEAVRGERLIGDFERLLEADRPAEAPAADLQEDLVGGEVVRILLSIGTAAVLVQAGWWDTEDLPTLQAAIADGSGFDGTDEYDPQGDDHYNLPAKAPQAMVLAAEDADEAAPKAQVRIEKWTAVEKQLQVSSPEAARIALRLLDYPAWRVVVNGKTVAPEHAEGAAQMVVPVSAGNSEIQLRFIATWDRRLGGIVSLLSAIIVLLMLAVRRRGENSQREN